MAGKGFIRSIRFSEELAELIDRQVGNSFTEKYENLITRCVWELPEKERQIESLDQQIHEKRQQLGRMSMRAESYSKMLRKMESDIMEISRLIAKAQEEEW